MLSTHCLPGQPVHSSQHTQFSHPQSRQDPAGLYILLIFLCLDLYLTSLYQQFKYRTVFKAHPIHLSMMSSELTTPFRKFPFLLTHCLWQLLKIIKVPICVSIMNLCQSLCCIGFFYPCFYLRLPASYLRIWVDLTYVQSTHKLFLFQGPRSSKDEINIC